MSQSKRSRLDRWVDRIKFDVEGFRMFRDEGESIIVSTWKAVEPAAASPGRSTTPVRRRST